MKQYQVFTSIVAFNNDPKMLTAAIRSTLDSSLRTACTVVDNSSNTSLRQYVLDSGARYIHAGKNLGFGAAHNLALTENIDTAEFCLIENPDIQFSSGVLETLYGFMLNEASVGLVMPKILYPDGRNQNLCKRLPAPHDLFIRRFLGPFGRTILKAQSEKYELSNVAMNVPWNVPCLSGCFMFVRSSVLKQVGLFDERYFMYMEDFDLCRRIGSRARTVYYPQVSITHEYAKGSYVNPRLLGHHILSSFRYFKKWGWYFDKEKENLNRRVAPFVSGGR